MHIVFVVSQFLSRSSALENDSVIGGVYVHPSVCHMLVL